MWWLSPTQKAKHLVTIHDGYLHLQQHNRQAENLVTLTVPNDHLQQHKWQNILWQWVAITSSNTEGRTVTDSMTLDRSAPYFSPATKHAVWTKWKWLLTPSIHRRQVSKHGAYIWACDKRCSRLTRVCLYTPIYFRLTRVTRNCGCFYSVCIDE